MIAIILGIIVILILYWLTRVSPQIDNPSASCPWTVVNGKCVNISQSIGTVQIDTRSLFLEINNLLSNLQLLLDSINTYYTNTIKSGKLILNFSMSNYTNLISSINSYISTNSQIQSKIMNLTTTSQYGDISDATMNIAQLQPAFDISGLVIDIKNFNPNLSLANIQKNITNITNYYGSLVSDVNQLNGSFN